jgi:hypothetical protein
MSHRNNENKIRIQGIPMLRNVTIFLICTWICNVAIAQQQRPAPPPLPSEHPVPMPYVPSKQETEWASHLPQSSRNVRTCTQASVDQPKLLAKTAVMQLDPCELVSISASNLRIIRNSIFAKHGYVFHDAELKDYFSRQSWYRPRSNYSDSELSIIEKDNINIIKKIEELNEIQKKEFPILGEGPYLEVLPTSLLKSIENDFTKVEPITNKWADVLKIDKTLPLLTRHAQVDKENPELLHSDGVPLFFVLYRYSLNYQSATCGEEYCVTDIYSPNGQLLSSIEFCPTHILKNPPFNLIKAADEGCGGEHRWLFRLYNYSTNKIIGISYYRGGYDLVWIPDGEKILLLAMNQQLFMINSRGELVNFGILKDHDYIVAAREVISNKLWIFKLSEGKYVIMTLPTATADMPAAVTVSTSPFEALLSINDYGGASTPTLLILKSGKYEFKFSRGEYKDEIKYVDLHPGQILNLDIRLQPKTHAEN